MYQNKPKRKPTNEYTVRRNHFGSAATDDYNLAEYLRPARAAGVGSDVAVPLLQAFVSGVVVGLLAIWPTTAFFWAWYIPAIVGGLAFAAAWFALLKSHRASLWDSEKYFHDVPQQPQQPQQMHVKLQIDEDGQHTKFVDLPLDPAQLKTIAAATINGRSFSLASWAGRGKLLSRSQFETLRDWLLDNDYGLWADENNHAAGFLFTNKGRAFWRGLVE